MKHTNFTYFLQRVIAFYATSHRRYHTDYISYLTEVITQLISAPSQRVVCLFKHIFPPK